jgi:hypothetical protein
MKALLALGKAAAAGMLLPALSGCASIGISHGAEAAYNAAFREKITDTSKLSADEQGRVRQVKVADSAPGPEGTPKGQVVGLACKLTVAVFVFKWVWKPELNDANGLTPEDAARTQLRVKAMQAGANTIVAPSCTHTDGVDWGNNCFESWRCTAQSFVIP